MKSWTPRLAIAALAFSGATLGFAQVAPSDAPRGVTHDCSGMTGTALATCLQLNRNVNDAGAERRGHPERLRRPDRRAAGELPAFECSRNHGAEQQRRRQRGLQRPGRRRAESVPRVERSVDRV